jgi:hypothetical protein
LQNVVKHMNKKKYTTSWHRFGITSFLYKFNKNKWVACPQVNYLKGKESRWKRRKKASKLIRYPSSIPKFLGRLLYFQNYINRKKEKKNKVIIKNTSNPKVKQNICLNRWTLLVENTTLTTQPRSDQPNSAWQADAEISGCVVASMWTDVLPIKH